MVGPRVSTRGPLSIMKINWWYIIGGAVVLSLLAVSYKTILQNFLKVWELYEPAPYWDFRQWSWGYGTRVPGSIDDPNVRPSGTISRAEAMTDAISHAETDHRYLRTLITRDLNPEQWAALLSFSYNLGPGNADNLVDNINSGDLSALGDQWNQYINAGGVPNDNLIARRAAEWKLFNS